MKKEDNKFLTNLSKLRLKKSFVAIFFAILSFLSYQVFYLFILFLILCLFFTVIGIISKQKASYISLLLLLGSILLYFLYYKPNYVDPNLSKNVLLGTWTYNDVGGTYVFNDDKTYYQYIKEDVTDNYCTGVYGYSYGVESGDGEILFNDPDYTYYLLLLKPTKCIIDQKETINNNKEFDKTMIFGYGIHDSSKSILVNTNTGNKSDLTHIK